MHNNSPRSASIVLRGLVVGAMLLLTGCDLSGLQKTTESMGVIVQLPSIETTVSAQVRDAASGELVETPVTLSFRGPDRTAPVDMYSDPISSQTMDGGVTSFGIRNDQQPTSADPVRLRVVAQAEGYQQTSEVIEIHKEGTKEIALDMLSANPKQQPKGATGVRDRSGTVRAGRVASELNVQTPAQEGLGSAQVHVPKGSPLRADKRSVDGRLTVDLSYYPPNEKTLDALPGNGTIGTGSRATRFTVVGYLNLRIRNAQGQSVSVITERPESSESPHTKALLPDGAVHPTTGEPLQTGDQLELFRYDAEAGVWHPDTTVRVASMRSQHTQKSGEAAKQTSLGIQWDPWGTNTSQLWAWGTQSQVTCEVGSRVQISPNEQAGTLKVRLQRSGLQYTGSVDISTLSTGDHALAQLLDQSSVPQYRDYSLTFTTRDGQTRTLTNVDPCAGSYAVTLPAPTSVPRTDVLFRAYPECPAGQKVRITAVPTVTIYYRESNAPSGAAWHTAGDEKISWIMDDPKNPTYIKQAELRLDGLKQETRYDLYTTYDGKRYEASGVVPDRDTASLVEDRVLVEYSQDFSSVCS
jgi:hypothetical protein